MAPDPCGLAKTSIGPLPQTHLHNFDDYKLGGHQQVKLHLFKMTSKG